MQSAPPWLLGEKSLAGLAQGKGAPGPWDRYKGHRGAMSPLAQKGHCSPNQEIRKHNCLILYDVWGPSRDETARGAHFQESDLPRGDTA